MEEEKTNTMTVVVGRLRQWWQLARRVHATAPSLSAYYIEESRRLAAANGIDVASSFYGQSCLSCSRLLVPSRTCHVRVRRVLPRGTKKTKKQKQRQGQETSVVLPLVLHDQRRLPHHRGQRSHRYAAVDMTCQFCHKVSRFLKRQPQTSSSASSSSTPSLKTPNLKTPTTASAARRTQTERTPKKTETTPTSRLEQFLQSL